MLRTKVIAADITNLTDARYFAAWGVDYLAFTGDPLAASYLSPAQIKEIIDWVEGPDAIISYPGLSVDETNIEQVGLIGIHQFIIGRYIDRSELPVSAKVWREITAEDVHEIAAGPVILKSSSMEEILDLDSEITGHEVYIDAPFNITEYDKLLSESTITGIILRGSEEEKVGLKSFDEVDDIMDFLMR